MENQTKGHCKHGEFILTDGCPQCIAERQASAQEANEPEQSLLHIVKVRYGAEATEGREYSYYSEEALTIGELIEVPLKNGSTKARVTAIGITEAEIASFKDSMRTIPAGSRYPGEKAVIPLSSIKTKEEAEEVGSKMLEQFAEEVFVVNEKDAAPELREPLFPGFLPADQTAIIQIAPDQDAAVKMIIEEAQAALAYAEALEIKSPEDRAKANNDLAVIGKMKKALTEKQADYTKPLNAYKDSILATFREMLAPILKADEVTRSKMMAYTREQERIRMQQEEINRKRQEAHDAEVALKGKSSEPVGLVEVAPAAPSIVRTEAGTSGMTAHWKYRVIDFALLPDAYKVEDNSQLSAIAKKHHEKKEVPGVEFYNEPSITMRAR